MVIFIFYNNKNKLYNFFKKYYIIICKWWPFDIDI